MKRYAFLLTLIVSSAMLLLSCDDKGDGGNNGTDPPNGKTPKLELNKSEIEIQVGEANKDFWIDVDASMTFKSQWEEEWLEITDRTSTIKVIATEEYEFEYEHTGDEYRTATVTVTGEGADPQTFTVKQYGKRLPPPPPPQGNYKFSIDGLTDDFYEFRYDQEEIRFSYTTDIPNIDLITVEYEEYEYNIIDPGGAIGEKAPDFRLELTEDEIIIRTRGVNHGYVRGGTFTFTAEHMDSYEITVEQRTFTYEDGKVTGDWTMKFYNAYNSQTEIDVEVSVTGSASSLMRLEVNFKDCVWNSRIAYLHIENVDGRLVIRDMGPDKHYGFNFRLLGTSAAITEAGQYMVQINDDDPDNRFTRLNDPNQYYVLVQNNATKGWDLILNKETDKHIGIAEYAEEFPEQDIYVAGKLWEGVHFPAQWVFGGSGFSLVP